MTYQLAKLKILLVEDMFPMLTLTKSILHIFGFREILTAREGGEALKIFMEENPDLVITDWYMDGMDGLELINKIRNNPETPNPYVPIILMTGYSSKHRVEKARDNGMTEYLMKPYTSKDLYNKIFQLIEKPRQFVKCKTFFGPDRRRKLEEYTGTVRRVEDYLALQEKDLVDAATKVLTNNSQKPPK